MAFKPATLTCPICHLPFERTGMAQVYCSSECWNVDHPKVNPQRTCPTCGATFLWHGTNQKYCSPKCNPMKCEGCGETWQSRAPVLEALVQMPGESISTIAVRFGVTRQRISQVLEVLQIPTPTDLRRVEYLREAGLNLTVYHGSRRTCGRCHEYKDIGEFAKDSRLALGRSYVCSACNRAHVNEYNARKRAEKVKA